MMSSILKHMSVAVVAALALAWSCSAWADDEVVTPDEESTVVEEETTTDDPPFLPPMVGATATTTNTIKDVSTAEKLANALGTLQSDDNHDVGVINITDTFAAEYKLVDLANKLKTVVINLGGNTLSGNNNEKGTLRFARGTVKLRNGTVKRVSQYPILNTYYHDSLSCTVELADNVTILGNGQSGASFGDSAQSGRKFKMATSTATIKGGETAVSVKGTATMSAGTIQDCTTAAYSVNGGTLTISGDAVITNCATAIKIASSGKVYVTGGKFLDNAKVFEVTSGTLQVSGGEYSSWDTDYNQYLKSGYTAVKMGEHWFVVRKYTISFNKNDEGASGSMDDMAMAYGVETNLTANAFVNTGYLFTGWATTAAGEVEYADGATVSNLTETAGGTVTLYAKWVYTPYKVTLHKDGGTCTDLTSYGSNIGATLPTDATKEGCTFGGWYTNALFKGEAWTEIAIGSTGDKEFWAKWLVQTPQAVKDDKNQDVTVSVSEAWMASNNVAKADLDTDGLNGIKIWKSYVLGLDPNDANSTTVVTPVQTTDTENLTINLGSNFKPQTDAGVDVKYRLDTSDGSTWTEGATEQDSPTFSTALPTSGVKYYKIVSRLYKK